MLAQAHLAAVQELRVGIEAAQKSLAERKEAEKHFKKACDKADKSIGDLREVAEGLVLGVDELKEKGGNEAHLEALTREIEKEVSFTTWLVEVEKDQKVLARVTGAAETLAAWIDAHGSTDGVEVEVRTILGEERMAAGKAFVDWYREHVGSFNVENGHIRLAMKDPAGAKAVYHAGKGNDPGLCELVWEKTGRRWEWMSSHPGGFFGAGRELVAIGRERVGRALMQSGNLEAKEVAMKLALYGGDELEGEFRDVIGIEPYGGGAAFQDALEMTLQSGVALGHSVRVISEREVVIGGHIDVKVWDLESGQCLPALDGPFKGVLALGVMGRKVVSGGNDGMLRVTNLDSGECIQVIPDSGRVLDLTVVDAHRVVTCGDDGDVFLWTAGEDGRLKKEKELEGHDDIMKCVLSLGGGLVASGGNNEMILVHDLESGAVVGRLEGHTDMVQGLAVLADGRLISASGDETLRVWPSSYTGEAEMVLRGHQSILNRVIVLENGMVVSADQSGCLRFWLVEGPSWKAVGEVTTNLRATDRSNRSIFGLRELPGSRVVTVALSGDVCVWNPSRVDGDTPPAQHASDEIVGAVLSDGRIATGACGPTGDLLLWKAAERGKSAELEQVIVASVHIAAVLAVPNGFVWVTYEEDDEGVYEGHFGHVDEPLWRLWLQTDGGEVAKIDENMGFMTALRCTPDGKTVLGLTMEGIYVWERSKDWKRSRVLQQPYGLCYDVVDNDHMVLCGLNGELDFLNVKSGAVVSHMHMNTRAMRLVFLGEGKVGVSYRTPIGDKLGLVELQGDNQPKVIDKVCRVFVSLGDGRTIAQIHDGSTIGVWNWKTDEIGVIFGGLDGLDVVDVAWDATRRLAVFFMEEARCWIAYEL